jgi:RNA polymerase sigma-70 factor (ECF subfamily)
MKTAAEHRPSDAQLAERIRAQDHDAFRVVMRQHNQKLFRVARAILRDDAEAEDAVQEGYLRAYCAIGAFRGDARLSTWLVRIVVNEALARLRRRNRGAEVIRLDGRAPENSGEDDMEVAHPEQPERAALRGEARKLLEGKIDALPEAFRAVFVLRAIEEFSVEETAAALGIPEATVRSRFFRARGLLRGELSKELDLAYGEVFQFAGERCDRIVAAVLDRLPSTTPRGISC